MSAVGPFRYPSEMEPAPPPQEEKLEAARIAARATALEGFISALSETVAANRAVLNRLVIVRERINADRRTVADTLNISCELLPVTTATLVPVMVEDDWAQAPAAWGKEEVDNHPDVASLIQRLEKGTRVLDTERRAVSAAYIVSPSSSIMNAVVPHVPAAMTLGAYHLAASASLLAIHHIRHSTTKRLCPTGPATVPAEAGPAPAEAADSDGIGDQSDARSHIGIRKLANIVAKMRADIAKNPVDFKKLITDLPRRLNQMFSDMHSASIDIGEEGSVMQIWWSTIQRIVEHMREVEKQLSMWWTYRTKLLTSFAERIRQTANIKMADVDDYARAAWGRMDTIVNSFSQTYELVGRTTNSRNVEADKFQECVLAQADAEFRDEMDTIVRSLDHTTLIADLADELPHPVEEAAMHTLADIQLQWPHLAKSDVTVDLMMDRNRNSLYTTFQDMVGMSLTIYRRLNGTKVTYSQDYNRMTNTYRTGKYMFENSYIVVVKGVTQLHTNTRTALPGGNHGNHGVQLVEIMSSMNRIAQMQTFAATMAPPPHRTYVDTGTGGDDVQA